MIVNADLRNLLKPPPRVSPTWRERLVQWLTMAAGDSYGPIYPLQREMIDRLVALESEAQALRSRAKELGSRIPALKAQGNLEQIKKNQQKSDSLKAEADGLVYTRQCALVVGDTIAAQLLDPDTIRHFANYQSPGFLGGKEGLTAEIDAAEHFLREGYMVLFNDLTHCLRLGDLTLANEKGVRTFEVKSSAREYLTRETARQIIVPAAVHDYIRTDVSSIPYLLPEDAGVARRAVRLNSDIEEDWHRDIAEQIHASLRNTPVVHLQRGRKHYLACRRRRIDDLTTTADALVRDGDWVVSNIRNRVNENAEVLPFTGWFDPDWAVELMSGELVVIAAFRMSDLAALFDRKGIAITWKREMTDLFPIRLEPRHAPPEYQLTDHSVGDHHRLKVLYGFCALETYVDLCAFLISPEAFAQFKGKIGKMKARAQPRSGIAEPRSGSES